MSTDNTNFLNFVKIIVGLPSTHCSYCCSYCRQRMYNDGHRCAYNRSF